MADQKINELPTKTAPSTGDKMLMIGTAEEYQIDYDKLASAILDKLATKQYSELDTTAKTVLGALDELNSKAILSSYEPPKPEDNDDISSIDIWTASTRKYGRLVNIQFNVHGTIKTTEKFITLYTLNEGYRPIESIIHNYISQNGTIMILNILSTGEVKLYTSEAITNDWIIRQSVIFVASL